MVAIELVQPGGNLPDPAAASTALEACRRRGVLVGRGGVHANVLRIAPPLSVTAEEVDEACAAIVDALADVSASRT
jgi:4-aminobutyrate aminotransferase